MKAEQLRSLAATLHRNYTPETNAYVDKKLQEMGLTRAELYQELEMADDVAEAFRMDEYASGNAPVHSHRFFEILYCQSNSDVEFLMGSRRYRLRRGDIVLVPPGVSHTFLQQEDAGESYRGFTLWISTDYLSVLQKSFPFLVTYLDKTGALIHTSGTIWEHLGDYFREAVNEAELRAPGWDSAVVGVTISLLTNLSRAIATQSAVSAPMGKPELLDQILAYVDGSLTEKISLEDVASRFWVSQSTISHLFRKKMGTPFYQYVMHRRLTEAKNLMLENMPIEKVSVKVGFGDYSAFYRAFRREYGMSPLQYRKLYCPDKKD